MIMSTKQKLQDIKITDIHAINLSHVGIEMKPYYEEFMEGFEDGIHGDKWKHVARNSHSWRFYDKEMSHDKKVPRLVGLFDYPSNLRRTPTTPLHVSIKNASIVDDPHDVTEALRINTENIIINEPRITIDGKSQDLSKDPVPLHLIHDTSSNESNHNFACKFSESKIGKGYDTVSCI